MSHPIRLTAFFGRVTRCLRATLAANPKEHKVLGVGQSCQKITAKLELTTLYHVLFGNNCLCAYSLGPIYA